MTVWLRGSRPFSTVTRSIVAGKRDAEILDVRPCAAPVDGSEPTYRASSGSASSTLNAPTMKNVKSAAFAKRAR